MQDDLWFFASKHSRRVYVLKAVLSAAGPCTWCAAIQSMGAERALRSWLVWTGISFRTYDGRSNVALCIALMHCSFFLLSLLSSLRTRFLVCRCDAETTIGWAAVAPAVMWLV